MYYLRISFLLLLLQVSFIYSQTPDSEVYDSNKFIDDGIKSYEEKQYLDAINSFDKIYKTDPNYAVAQYEKLLCLGALEKKEEKIQLYEKLKKEKLLDTDVNLLMSYAVFLSDEKEFEKSEEYFKKLITLVPDSYLANFNFGLLYLRKEERQKSVDYLKKSIELNPNVSSGHYFLGLIAFEDGKVVEGALCMIAYLANSPMGRYASDAVIKLNTKLADNYLVTSKIKFTNSGDNFKELEEILRNSLPLNKKYKIKSDIDDVVTRQVQAVFEYAATHKIENGFFENIYIPFIKDIQDRNLQEAFSYYMLLSVEENLGKALFSKKKDIISFQEKYIQTLFWEKYAKRKVSLFGEEKEAIVYLNDGHPFLIGEKKDGKLEGKCKIVDKHGRLTGELFYKNDNLEGLQKYYYPTTGLLSEETNFVNGQKNGISKEYYTNGAIELEANYKNNILNGSFTSYYPTGGKRCEMVFKDNILEGKMTCYYPNGTVEKDINYINNLQEGKSTFYLPNGDIKSTFNYIAGKLEGEASTYFDGKIVKTTSSYKNDSNVSDFFEYNEIGIKTEQSQYFEGKIKKSTIFSDNGTIENESTYDKNGLQEKISYYNIEGKKFFEEIYKNGELKEALQIDATGNVINKQNFQNKTYTMKTIDNLPKINGFIEKGKMVKEWKYYWENGNLKRIYSYQNNKTNGLCEDFDVDGKKTYSYYTKDGNIGGKLLQFNDEKLFRVMYYNEGKSHGPYQYFYPNKKLSYEGFIKNDESIQNQYFYYFDGGLKSINFYIEDELIKTKSFDKTGNVIFEFDYTNKNGQNKYEYTNKAYTFLSNFKNGKKEGIQQTKYGDGSLISEVNYINNELHGICKYYHPTNKLSTLSNYYCGKRNGEQKYYDANGILRLTENESFGNEYGKITRYYQNGQKIFEYNATNNEKDGDQLFFNEQGKPVVALGYKMGILKYYKTLENNGTLGNEILISNNPTEIISMYPDGSKAFSVKVDKRLLEGKLEIFSEKKYVVYSSENKNGSLEGKRIEYYDNGKIYKEENYLNGKYHGLISYFNLDGSKLYEANYQYDELHGDYTIFDKGKKKKIFKFDTDELLEIISNN